MHGTALPRRTHTTPQASIGARAAIIGGCVLASSLGIWHQVLAPGLHVEENSRFLAFGLFVASLFTFAFLVGAKRQR